MARKRKERTADDIKLRQPDRSGPTEKTLLDLAQERSLFEQADKRQEEIRRSAKAHNAQASETEEEEEDEDGIPPVVERILESILWTFSLAMLHFTLDVLVQHQYAVEISWMEIVKHTGLAFVVFLMLFYTLHPHSSNPTLLPGLPTQYQYGLRQVIFFVTSVCAGCYLIHITNKYSYIAVMKQAPPIGCLWVWSVIELDLQLSVLSLALDGVFMGLGGYSLK